MEGDEGSSGFADPMSMEDNIEEDPYADIDPSLLEDVQPSKPVDWVIIVIVMAVLAVAIIVVIAVVL